MSYRVVEWKKKKKKKIKEKDAEEEEETELLSQAPMAGA
jgi:hypothetical protein